MLAACQPPAPEPTPVPSPTPVVTPAPTPTAVATVSPVFENWQDAPQTPGDWRYVSEPTETLAVFGTGRTPDTVELIIRCDLATRRVGIARSGRANGQVEMLIRTETQDRTLTATPVNAAAPLLTVELSARDSLLDAIVFSKGRFAVEAPGTNGLYAPAYPEITRVMEDCRG
ncbi:hypothetical protein [Aurantiacibacter sp. D1-12]|uniref:hypothetical protein n=1 Tax=Aurantiacibacter sp. D1-12 TaxID=2993658 RepID=UPI00237C83B3|nr:hypothetical protein [Aurantiacibacter sp. D1-12]MDE1467947.1 hypothetical protein [Aurantiacibacter sp. D1-12]